MPAFEFTVRAIEALIPVAGRQVDYFDASLGGLTIRVAESGRKTWCVFYRPQGSRRLRRLTLGQCPPLSLVNARFMAKKVLYEAALGEDPGLKKQQERKAESFEELSQKYLEEHARPKKRSHHEDERIIRRELLPHWKGFKAKSIVRSDVKVVLKEIVDRGSPIQANRVLAITRKIFNFGIQEEIVDINPCRNIPAPAKERQRERVLNADEIRRVWETTDYLASNPRLFFRLMLLLAQRPGEVIRMSWDEISLDDGWWTIPPERAKNSLGHRVPLTRTSRIFLLEQRLAVGGSPWVFPSRFGNSHQTELKRALAKIRDCTGIEFIPRDLRRTVASHLTSMGIPRLTVSKLLNHKENSVTAVYDRYSYDQDKKNALERWDGRLTSLLSSAVEVKMVKQP